LGTRKAGAWEREKNCIRRRSAKIHPEECKNSFFAWAFCKKANLIKWVCTPGRFLKSLSIIVDKRNSLMYFFAAYSTGRIIIFAARVLQKKKNCRIKKSKMI